MFSFAERYCDTDEEQEEVREWTGKFDNVANARSPASGHQKPCERMWCNVFSAVPHFANDNKRFFASPRETPKAESLIKKMQALALNKRLTYRFYSFFVELQFPGTNISSVINDSSRQKVSTERLHIWLRWGLLRHWVKTIHMYNANTRVSCWNICVVRQNQKSFRCSDWTSLKSSLRNALECKPLYAHCLVSCFNNP